MKTRSIVIFLWVVVAVTSVATVVLFQNLRPPRQIRVGYLAITTGLPLFVAVENGYFEEEGVEINLVRVANSNEAMNALASGELDVSVGNGLSTSFLVEQNTPGLYKIFLPLVETEEKSVMHLVVRKDSPINSVDDLPGRKLGFYRGTSILLYAKLLLQKLGIPQDQVTFIQVAPQLQVPSLAAGQFDVLLCVEPYATTAVEQGIARMLVEGPRVKYIMEPFSVAGNYFSTKFLKEDPESASKIMAAMERAVRFIREDERGAKKLLPKYTPLTESIAEKSHVYEWWLMSEIQGDKIQRVADMFYEGGLLDKRIDTKTLLLNNLN